MKLALFFLLPLLFAALILLPLVPIYKKAVTGKKAKHLLWYNLVSFAGTALAATVTPLCRFFVFAADGASLSVGAGLAYLSAALATGMACIGAGIAVANGASAAIGACAEDPKSFGRSIVFVALGEGVAIYGLLISIMIINSIG